MGWLRGKLLELIGAQYLPCNPLLAAMTYNSLCDPEVSTRARVSSPGGRHIDCPVSGVKV